MEPGKVFTRQELKEQFNFVTDEGVDYFLDLLENTVSDGWRVIDLMGERVLVFAAEAWEAFLLFMEQTGHKRDSEA